MPPPTMSFFQLLEALATNHWRSEDEINKWKAECERLRPLLLSTESETDAALGAPSRKQPASVQLRLPSPGGDQGISPPCTGRSLVTESTERTEIGGTNPKDKAKRDAKIMQCDEKCSISVALSESNCSMDMLAVPTISKDLRLPSWSRPTSVRERVLAGTSPRLTFMPPGFTFTEEESSVGWSNTSYLARFRYLISPGGVIQTLRWPGFDAFIGCIIVLDGLLLGVEAENNLDPFITDKTWINVLAWIFKAIFAFEISLRFYAFGVRQALMCSWIRFDAFLVSCAVMDVVVGYIFKEDQEMVDSMLVLRVFRLARLVRAARLMVQFRTLWLLISGLRASLQTVMWTWVLLLMISYIFAVLGMEVIPPRDLSRETVFGQVASDKFGSLLQAMLTLLQVLTLDSIAAIYRPLIREGKDNMPVFVIVYFVLFILFVSVALMNLVTAVMVEGSMQQASQDREALRAIEEKRKKALVPKLRSMFEAIDKDKSGDLSLEELEAAPRQMQDELRGITNMDDLSEVFYLLDVDDSGAILIDEFLEGILKASTGDVMQRLQMSRIVRQMTKLQALANQRSDEVVLGANSRSLKRLEGSNGR